MGDPVDGDREKARVRRDHLVEALGGGVALRDRLRILLEPVVDVGQGGGERVHDPVGLARLRERRHEPAKVAHGQREPCLQLVGSAGRALGELSEEDPQQLVDEDGDVALERESPITRQSLLGKERGEGVDAIVRLAHGHRLRGSSARLPRDAGAEALAAWVGLAGGWVEDAGHGWGPPGNAGR